MISVAMFGCTALSSLAIHLTGDELITALLFGIISIGGLIAMIRMQVHTNTNTSVESPKNESETQTVPEPKKLDTKKKAAALVIGTAVVVGLCVAVKTYQTRKRI
jgi:hypothetical protein